MCDGLGYGDNTKATLMTRGLAEMSRLGGAMGANPLTYMGLAGMGDLIATCTSRHSRNRALGELIAKGGTHAAVLRRDAHGRRGRGRLHHRRRARQARGPRAADHAAGPRHPVRGTYPYRGAEEALLGREAKDELHGLGLVAD